MRSLWADSKANQTEIERITAIETAAQMVVREGFSLEEVLRCCAVGDYEDAVRIRIAELETSLSEDKTRKLFVFSAVEKLARRISGHLT